MVAEERVSVVVYVVDVSQLQIRGLDQVPSLWIWVELEPMSCALLVVDVELLRSKAPPLHPNR